MKRNNIFHLICSIAFLITAKSSFSQVKLGKILVGGEFNLPVSSGNSLFKTWVQGLGGGGVSVKYRYLDQWVLGIGGQYSYFVINEFKVPTPVRGNMQVASGFLEIGHEKHHTETVGTSFTLRTGYSQAFFNSSLCTSTGVKKKGIESVFIQPTASLVLMADEISSFRFTFGYSFHSFAMTPDRICSPTAGGFEPSDYKRGTSYLYISLGYTHYFGKP